MSRDSSGFLAPAAVLAPAAFLAPAALLPDGWHKDVELRWNSDGILTKVEPRAKRSPPSSSAPSGGLTRLAGPVIAGMPNLHSHAFQRALLGRVQSPDPGDDFWSWRSLMYQTVEALTPDLVYKLSAWTFGQMVASGYTSVVEFHYIHRPGGAPPTDSLNAILDAARASGIRLTLAPVLYRWGDSTGSPLSSQQRAFYLDHGELQDLVARITQSKAALALAPHSLRAASADDLHFLTDLAGDVTPLHIHVSEQPAEVRECLKSLGSTPIEWLDREFGLSPRWGLVHCTQATDSELDILDLGGPTLILCPTTEHDLGDGRFPLEQAPSANWGIGSDSHVSLSPAQELRTVLYGMRASAGKRAVFEASPLSDGTRLWQSAASVAPSVSGWPNGQLRAGATADFLVLDPEAPDLVGLSPDEMVSAWVLSGQTRDLAEVRVGGEILARHGVHENSSQLDADWRQAMRTLRV
ncbi:MAG: formimidoylglutamate deiminase [Rhodothermales bacterium]|jgi:formimidoylglutamate deiminase